jgi:acyl-CoA thioester hydrolase
MLNRADIEPVFFAPFVSSVMRVDPSWIDYNGHLNMAYYHVLFDRAVDEAFALVGIDPAYVERRRHSFFTAEVHVCYLRELHAADPVRVTLHLLDCDAKRLHFFERLCHATEGFVSATAEQMALHVDMESRKTAPFPHDVAERVAAMKASHTLLPRPAAAGRRISMPPAAAGADPN